MLLAIDIGNTHTVFGVFEKRKLLADWRMSSAVPRTEDELGTLVQTLCERRGLKKNAIRGVAISSVVPNLTEIFVLMSRKYYEIEPLIVSAQLKLGIRIHYDDPSTVGADRLCNAVAGFAKYGGPLIIIDFGTATTYDVVSKNGDYLGGVIAPGIETSAADLHRRAAKLPKIELKFPPDVVGKDTVSSMQSGILYGAVDAMEGMVERIKAVIGKDAKVLVTGGYWKLMKDQSHLVDHYEPALVLHGLQLVYERATKKSRRRS
jgi:type III pantothenate kinase